MEHIGKYDISHLGAKQQILLMIALFWRWRMTPTELSQRMRVRYKTLYTHMTRLIAQGHVKREFIDKHGKVQEDGKGCTRYYLVPTRNGIRYINYILERDGPVELKVLNYHQPPTLV
jgi:hypothetical protein